MPPLFLPRLVNGPLGDPGLYIPFQFDRRALLFDLGDISHLPPRELLKISHVFVTHTHMDHFIGFDPLLRCLLGRRKDLCLYGPAGFIRNAEGKLAGYSWDLLDPATCGLTLHLTEVTPEGSICRTYVGGEGFAPAGEARRRPFDGRLHVEPAFEVAAAVLEHSIPCLGLMLTERFHVNILKTGLDGLGLPPGPWLKRFKAAVYAGQDPAGEFEIVAGGGGPRRRMPLGELQAAIARITPGQRVAYIADVGDSAANRAAIAALAADADLMFIEAAFLDADRRLAAARHHLTARQAGEIAALAGARHISVFHFSPRYEGREEELVREAREAHGRAARAVGVDGAQAGVSCLKGEDPT